MGLRDIVGQNKAVGILTGMLSNNRVASTLLFTGLSGIGKKYTAFQFIKAINCSRKISDEVHDSCDDCITCNKISSAIHPDMRVIETEESVIKIEKIRELEEFISFTPSEGVKKCIIVDDAHKMNINAYNAFLKTLEEPPANCVIILITNNEGTLPDTIRSRCINIVFVPLSPDKIRIIADKNSLNISDDQVRLSGGSFGKLINDDLLQSQETAFTFFRLMMKEGEAGQWKNREEMMAWFEFMSEFLRDMVIYKIYGDNGNLINFNKAKEIVSICKYATIKSIIECYDKIEEIKKHEALNLNKAIVLKYVQSLFRNVFNV